MAKSVEDLEKQLAAEKRREAAAKTELDSLIAEKKRVEANRGTVIDAKIKALEDSNEQLRQQLATQNYQPSIEDQNAIADAYHRANRVYSMIGDAMPLSMPGESSLRYRRRLANGLRKYTKGWQRYAFHDSQQVQDFSLVENAIYAEAEDHAKNPPPGTIGKVREIVTTAHGKTRVEFVGDQRVVWAPFAHPVKFAVEKITRPAGNVYR